VGSVKVDLITVFRGQVALHRAFSKDPKMVILLSQQIWHHLSRRGVVRKDIFVGFLEPEALCDRLAGLGLGIPDG
jgi:hypothetical protein